MHFVTCHLLPPAPPHPCSWTGRRCRRSLRSRLQPKARQAAVAAASSPLCSCLPRTAGDGPRWQRVAAAASAAPPAVWWHALHRCAALQCACLACCVCQQPCHVVRCSGTQHVLAHYAALAGRLQPSKHHLFNSPPVGPLLSQLTSANCQPTRRLCAAAGRGAPPAGARF